jgi:hypothetical protein
LLLDSRILLASDKSCEISGQPECSKFAMAWDQGFDEKGYVFGSGKYDLQSM